MTVADEKAPVRPVKVWFGYPDVEVRTQSYPYAVVELIDILPAYERQNSGIMYDSDNRGTIAAQPGVVYRYSMPVPYDLVYQITTYSRHPRHDRAMLFQMQQKFPSQYGSLPMPNAINTESAYRHMFLDGFLKRDQIEDGKRLFRAAGKNCSRSRFDGPTARGCCTAPRCPTAAGACRSSLCRSTPCARAAAGGP